jgi:integrase
VRISPSGTKSFALAYGSKGRRYTIGKFPEISLAQARTIAKGLKVQIAKGIDPQTEKKKQRKAPVPKTFSELVKAYKKSHFLKLKPSTRKDYERRIDNVILPAFGKLLICSVTKHDILYLLEEIAEQRNKPIQANRIRSILSSIFSFGINRGFTETNPVHSIKPLAKERVRYRVYTDKEIKLIWTAFEGLAEPYCSLFKILLILGQRSGETRKMRWDEIEENVWTIPPEKNKANRLHVIPMPAMVMKILMERRKHSKGEFVFESPVKKGQPINWLQYRSKDVRTASGIKDFRLHDLRRTVASNLAKDGVDRTVIGKILNHKGLAGDDQITAVYDQHDYLQEKEDTLIRWSNRLESILNINREGANIYYLRSLRKT